jgi:glycosyltransferase involved in cell wall biosynthesis
LIERAGVPTERIHVRPNWGEEPAIAGEPGRGDYVLFVGRLSPEKGVATLVDAAAATAVPLVIAGDGPLRAELEARVLALGAATRIRFVGWQPPAEIARLAAGARCVACPSGWYEAGPLVVVEAFALGRAVIAARIGALAEAVEDGVTGWLVPPSDSAAWRVALQQAWSDPDDARRRGAAARRRYEDAYSPPVGYRRLMDIYGAVLGRVHAQL